MWRAISVWPSHPATHTEYALALFAASSAAASASNASTASTAASASTASAAAAAARADLRGFLSSSTRYSAAAVLAAIDPASTSTSGSAAAGPAAAGPVEAAVVPELVVVHARLGDHGVAPPARGHGATRRWCVSLSACV